MKALLLALVISTGTIAATTNSKEIECHMIIRMFYFSIEQERPITDVQLTAAIDACKYIEGHKEFVADMQHMIHNTSGM